MLFYLENGDSFYLDIPIANIFDHAEDVGYTDENIVRRFLEDRWTFSTERRIIH